MSDIKDTSIDGVQPEIRSRSGISRNEPNPASDSALTLESVREKCGEEITQGFRETNPVLIEALPSSGKSFGLIKWATTTGKPLTVFTSRLGLYDQYAEWCSENGLSYCILPSFYRSCKTGRGEYGKKWTSRVSETYKKGLFPSEIHENARKLYGQKLPCQQEGDCAYFDAKDIDTQKYDVLIGHYTHAHAPNYVVNRYVALDEFPEDTYLTEFSAGEVNAAVSTFLDQNPDFPFEYLKDLKEYRHQQREKGTDWFEQNNLKLRRDASSVISDMSNSAHSHAGAMAYAILTGDVLDNRWEYAGLPDGRKVARNPKTEALTLLNPPALENARSVVALDGTPTLMKWRLVLGDTLQHKSLLSREEKQTYLQDTLNLCLIQTSRAANHYSGRAGISVTPELDLTLFEAIKSREKQSPALITSKTALEQYKKEGLSEITTITDYYGNIKGENKFSETRIGIVAGSSHYGDEYLKKWAALCGHSAERVEGTKGMEQDFGDLGNELLRGMRENEVLQAAMRFGRDSKGANVYIHTSALPEWVPLQERLFNTSINKWSDGMKDILTALEASEKSEWKTKEITNQVKVSEQQVRTHLHKLVDYGYLDYHQEGRGFLWTDVSLNQCNQRGHVVFADRKT
jgi:hypothetical protein